jgi:Calcineurin-like phosphoesterase
MHNLFSKKKLAIILLLATAVIFAAQSCNVETKPWSFGVMGDTQWTPNKIIDGKFVSYDPAGTNPNNVSVSIIRQIQREFIKRGVKFVIQVGDLSDEGNNEAIVTRAEAAQELYDAGIGFFPMRGNHETYYSLFFPGQDNGFCVPVMQASFPQNREGSDHHCAAYNFSSPTSADFPNMESELDGLSYAFDYGDYANNATFVILDPWATPTQLNKDFYNTLRVYYGYTIGSQQEWISKRLNRQTRGTVHAFVFSHQPLIAANHIDSPFGYLDSAVGDQNAFYKDLADNDVAYYISGHDHIYERNIAASPDGIYKVEELIASPACPKFYGSLADDNAGWHGQKYRATTLSQEKNNVGFYIYTVNGPTVTVDYYSDVNGNFGDTNKWPDKAVDENGYASCVTPSFNFIKKETWSFSLNGKGFMVRQGEDYTGVMDEFAGTSARILGGTNNSTAVNDLGKSFVKKVNTSWDLNEKNDSLHSNILTLTGMAGFSSITTDTYALSMSFNDKMSEKDPKYYLAARDSNGRFVNAVDLNDGGIKTFVNGPWDASYGLGTYGVDKAANTVWAVVNFNGTFAVKK